jgi:iron complex outermembrane receptor protein
MSTRDRGLCAAVSVLALVAAGSSAFGQSTAVEGVVITAPTTTPLDQVVAIDKTGARIEDIPRSIQIIPRDLIELQGATLLSDTLRDVSGVSQGGQFAFGFFDRFIIRGLNVTYLNDGLPDGTSDLTGYVHSLTGVARVEVLKGPGSALYGDAEPGGTINLVHYRPSDTPSATISEQVGSFGTTTTDVSATGPTGLANVDWRIDGAYQSSDGFRGLGGEDGDVLAAMSWRPDRHDVELRFEYHHLENRPDATGIPFSPPNGVGAPVDVPTTDTYYTPFAFADQDVERIFLSDSWSVNDFLTLNLRSAYSNRDVDLARNSGGSVTLVDGDYALTNRQLREQNDAFGDFNFQAEPTWRFSTGPVGHVLVTGFDARQIEGDTERKTADLPNIGNILDPVVDDGSLSSLTFKCDATHSCDNARLSAEFFGLYAIDQMDVTQALKLRFSVRQNWFDTEGQARSTVPVNSGEEQPCNPPQAAACPWIPGVPVRRDDSIVNWDAGAVYFLSHSLSVFSGYSTVAYPIFNTEEPETVGQTPERGTQVEGGLRYQAGGWLTLSTSVYRATRDNVFTLLSEPGPSGSGDIDVAQVFSYRVTGWEADLNLRPTPRWNLIANLALQDDRITSYPQTPTDLGKRAPSIPPSLANLWTTYDIPIDGSLSSLFKTAQLSFGVRYRGNEFADAANTRLVPGVPLFDLGLGLPLGAVTVTMGVENLFDRENFLYGDGTGGGALPGPGRTVFLKLSAKVW